MTIRLRIFCIVTLFCIPVSCSRVPQHIISERKMRVVLYDMQIAEAIVEKMPESYPTSDDRMTVYEAVFAKHQITQAEFDSSLVWYGKHVDLYMGIYQLVLKDLNANLAAFSEIKPEPIIGDISGNDSIDIWIYNRSEIFSPKRVFNAILFDIFPQNPYLSGSSYVFELSVWGIPPLLKYKPKIHISAIQADTVISVIKEVTGDGFYEADVRTVDSLDVKRIYGYIYMPETDVTYHSIYLNDIRLMKYKNEVKVEN